MHHEPACRGLTHLVDAGQWRRVEDVLSGWRAPRAEAARCRGEVRDTGPRWFRGRSPRPRRHPQRRPQGRSANVTEREVAVAVCVLGVGRSRARTRVVDRPGVGRAGAPRPTAARLAALDAHGSPGCGRSGPCRHMLRETRREAANRLRAVFPNHGPGGPRRGMERRRPTTASTERQPASGDAGLLGCSKVFDGASDGRLLQIGLVRHASKSGRFANDE